MPADFFKAVHQVLIQASFCIRREVKHEIDIHREIVLRFLDGPLCGGQFCLRIILAPEPCFCQFVAGNAGAAEAAVSLLSGGIFIKDDVGSVYTVGTADVHQHAVRLKRLHKTVNLIKGQHIVSGAAPSGGVPSIRNKEWNFSISG